jgi:transglutaminase-like putative cysteine protease
MVVGLVLLSVCREPDRGSRLDGRENRTQWRHIAFGFTLQNETDRPIGKVEFWTYGPVKQTATQRIDRLQASHPYLLISDRFGNQILHFTFLDLPPYGSKIVSIEATVSLSESPLPMDDGNPGAYLMAGKFMESQSLPVMELAGSLARKTDARAPLAFFRWITENIRNDAYTRNERGALTCLNARKGDCTEQMALFVALCRAAGIPARGLGGYVCDGDRMLKADDYHNWAEFQTDGLWRLADPQKRVFAQDPSRYIAFRVITGTAGDADSPMGAAHRFRFEGEGLRVRMNP